MKKTVAIIVSSLFLANLAFAASCEEMALSKEGKPLHGAAKAASVKKCLKDNPTATAAPATTAAATSEGKIAQQGKMKKCNVEAAGKKGDERKAFMKTCLSN